MKHLFNFKSSFPFFKIREEEKELARNLFITAVQTYLYDTFYKNG